MWRRDAGMQEDHVPCSIFLAVACSRAPRRWHSRRPAIAQGAPLKIGLMLPFSGTFAALGENIAAAFELCLAGT